MRVRRGVLVGVAGLAMAGIAAVAVVGIATLPGSRRGTTQGESGSCYPNHADFRKQEEIAPVPTGGTPSPAVQTVAGGLCVPWGLAFLPNGTALVGERGTGRLLSVTPTGQVTELQRFSGINTHGEAGLLGIAVSPNYATDRWVYAYYTARDDNRIVRFHLGQAPEPILTGIPASDFHHGGRLAFGPDGMLYATTGETYYTREIAQDRNSLGGKILRLTPNGRPAPGNPFPGSPVYSLGHRNVQGIAWDSQGRLYASELGEDRYDELNLIRPGGNYGWPVHEGVAHDSRYIDPIATWAPAEASPSGIAIVSDHIYIACLRGQRLYRLGLDGRHVEQLLVGYYGRLRTVAPAPDGSLWLLTTNRDQATSGASTPASDDRILRLTL